MEYIEVSQELPELNRICRTYAMIKGKKEYEQKAMLKEDGWYYPSGLTKLTWTPTHWQYV